MLLEWSVSDEEAEEINVEKIINDIDIELVDDDI